MEHDKATTTAGPVASNRGKLLGQQVPFKLNEIWAIRIRLQIGEQAEQLALFNLAIDSKLRGCDLVKLRVGDVAHGNRIASRAIGGVLLVRLASSRQPRTSRPRPSNASVAGSTIALAGAGNESLPVVCCS